MRKEEKQHQILVVGVGIGFYVPKSSGPRILVCCWSSAPGAVWTFLIGWGGVVKKSADVATLLGDQGGGGDPRPF